MNRVSIALIAVCLSPFALNGAARRRAERRPKHIRVTSCRCSNEFRRTKPWSAAKQLGGWRRGPDTALLRFEVTHGDRECAEEPESSFAVDAGSYAEHQSSTRGVSWVRAARGTRRFQRFLQVRLEGPGRRPRPVRAGGPARTPSEGCRPPNSHASFDHRSMVRG